MKVIVLCLFLGAALGASFKDVLPEDAVVGYNYHEKYGIPAAAKLKVAETALNFDGSRIFGGNLAFTGDFPYMGGLLIILRNGLTTICGSSLLSNTKLVTAAACWWDGVHHGLSATVVLGTNMIYVTGTRIATNDITLHPRWDPRGSIENNMAMITIRRVEFSNNIRPIALPSGSLLNNNFAGTVARAAGFGMLTDWDTGLGTNSFLYFVDLEVLSNADCSRYYNNIVGSILCTSGAQRRSICRGDIGGPLAIRHNGQDTLIGVASFISQYGCTVGRPAGFTRVGSYVDWIRSHL